MKKLILFLLMALWAQGAWAVPTLIANTCAGSSNTSSVTTSAINTTGASLIIATLSMYHTSYTTITDNESNTWTPLTQSPSGQYNSVIMFYVTNPTTSASHTFTEPSSGNYPTLCVMAFSGTGAFDVQNNNYTGGTPGSTGSITPNYNGELLITGEADNGGSAQTINDSFTLPTNGNITSTAQVGGNHMGGANAYFVQTTAAAINPSWSSSSATTLSTSIASFQASAAVSTVSTIYTGSTGIVHGANIN